MSLPPAIIDTNVVVAGLLTGDADSPVARILDDMLTGRFPFIVSSVLVAEYRAVLLRPRIQQRHGLTAARVDDVLTAVVTCAMVRDVMTNPQRAPDPRDQHLWDLLAAVPRAVLVTGDSALQVAAGAGVAVLSPREWISEVERKLPHR